MTRRIFVVRHGETDWNLAGRLQGGGKDIPLNDLGCEQAARTAKVIERLAGDIGPLDFVASPLSRTVQTMSILRAELGLPPDAFRRDERLKEISFGRWEGNTWRELKRREPQSIAVRRQDPWHFRPPDGETYAEVERRALEALSDLTRDSVVVTHGGVIRTFLHALTRMPAQEAAFLPVRQGAVYLIEDGAFELTVA